MVPQFWHRTEEENETIATSEVKIGQGSTFEAPSTPPFRTFEGYDGYVGCLRKLALLHCLSD